MKKPEILAPAGSLEVLKTAVIYGADAVYIGGEAYGLRAAAHNFDKEEMAEGISFAHEHGAKVFVTANIYAHNSDLEGVREYFGELKELRPDAVLIADPGVFTIAKEIIPDIPIHISTQSNNVNYETFKFWHSLGAERVVTGRELSLDEIRGIRANVPETLEIETFAHGAMCMSYSGRCLMSNYMTGRDANKGACTHPCRWTYSLVEEQRPGEYMPVFENERGTFIFNSKDLCMIEHIPELVGAGVDSLKIEGRMKTALYVATVVRAYRKAVDMFFESEEDYKAHMSWFMREVESSSRRKYCTGFFFEKAGEESMYYEAERVAPMTYMGTVEEVVDGCAVITQKNKFSTGDTMELMKPSGENIIVTVAGILDEHLSPMSSCPHPKQKLFVKFGESVKIEKYDILRSDIVV